MLGLLLWLTKNIVFGANITKLVYIGTKYSNGINVAKMIIHFETKGLQQAFSHS